MTIKRAMCLGVASILFSIAASIVIVVGVALYEGTNRTCIMGKVFVPRKSGYIDMGEVEFCGNNFSLSSIYNPSMERQIYILRVENIRLQDELNQCKESTSI